MKSRRDEQRRIAQEAADWLRIMDGAGPDERAAFTEWLLASPRNVRELLLLTAVDKTLDQLDPECQVDIERLIAGGTANVVPLNTDVSVQVENGPHRAADLSTDEDGQPAFSSQKRWLRWGWAAGAAAIGVVLALVSWFPVGHTAQQRYATGIGEQRTFRLKDGSVLYLNTHSEVEVRFSSAARDVRLVEGEALFTVRHDPARAFRVRTADAVIQALGTEFNVYQRADETHVAVVVGRVRIAPESSPRRSSASGKSAGSKAGIANEAAGVGAAPVMASAAALGAGEEATVARGGSVLIRATPDVAAAIAWRQRRLVFRETELAQIADEFNRYNRTPQLRIEGEALRARQFNGVFDADDPETFLKFLATEPGIAVDTQGLELVIRQR